MCARRGRPQVYHNLKAVIKKKFGLDATAVGDEGGFAPNIQDNEEALTMITEAIEKAGYTGKIEIGMDVAASEFFKWVRRQCVRGLGSSLAWWDVWGPRRANEAQCRPAVQFPSRTGQPGAACPVLPRCTVLHDWGSSQDRRNGGVIMSSSGSSWGVVVGADVSIHARV